MGARARILELQAGLTVFQQENAELTKVIELQEADLGRLELSKPARGAGDRRRGERRASPGRSAGGVLVGPRPS